MAKLACLLIVMKDERFLGQGANTRDTHGSRADPEVLLLNKLHALVHPFVPQDLKNSLKKKKKGNDLIEVRKIMVDQKTYNRLVCLLPHTSRTRQIFNYSRK